MQSITNATMSKLYKCSARTLQRIRARRDCPQRRRFHTLPEYLEAFASFAASFPRAAPGFQRYLRDIETEPEPGGNPPPPPGVEVDFSDLTRIEELRQLIDGPLRAALNAGVFRTLHARQFAVGVAFATVELMTRREVLEPCLERVGAEWSAETAILFRGLILNAFLDEVDFGNSEADGT